MRHGLTKTHLLCSNRYKKRNHLSIPIRVERAKRILQATQCQYIGEGRDLSDSVVKVVNRERVLTSTHGFSPSTLQYTIDTDSMQLFLSLNHGQRFHDRVSDCSAADLISRHVVGDVPEQSREIGHLKDLSIRNC